MRFSPSCKLRLAVASSALALIAARPAFATSNPTTTTLTVTSAGSAVSSISSGRPVMLTAAVVSGATKITTGQVNFCDASVTYCTDIHLLGTAQLTIAGTAAVKFVASPGVHVYKAVFAGTQTNAPSVSSNATLTVTGTIPSAVTFTTNFQPGTPSLTAVAGGAGTTAPGGSISFLNASNSNAVLGTATLGTGTAGLAFLNTGFQFNSSSTVPRTEPGPDFSAAAVGDFNGDGILDIAGTAPLSTGGDATATAVLGDGHGSFTAAAPTDIGRNTSNTIPIAVADFNGDGILDLVSGSGTGSNGAGNEWLTVSLGKGDGTFTAGQNLSVGATGTSFVVADFNRDGIPDLAVLSPTASLITLFLGNGDGTFTASTEPPTATSSNPQAIAVGDFNGDGIPDLVTSHLATSLTILLGNGNGTFTATTASPATGSSPQFITVGDFNQDGKLDLAVANTGSGTVTVLLGNGDGTFTAASGSPVTYTTSGMSPNFMGAGDFNGDGKLDLLIDPFVALLGNGDGTFTLTSVVGLVGPSGLAISSGLAAGDFNGDGLTDIAGASIAQLAATHTAATPATRVTLPPATGKQFVAASYLGDNTYQTTTSGTLNLPAGQGTPTVMLALSSNSISLGGAVTFTATVAPIAVTPTGTVTFYSGSAQLGTGTVNSSGVATYTTSALPVGTHSITANYGGDSNYTSATSASSSVTVTSSSLASTLMITPSATSIPRSQPLTVMVGVAGAAGGAMPTGTVNLSSGTYTSQEPLVNGSASFTIVAGTLAAGANIITASYSGDATYAAQTGTVTVTLADISLAIPAPSAVAAGSSATATATVTTGTVYAGTLNLTCALTASPAGAQHLPSCSLSPTNLALKSSASGTSVVTVTTTAASSTASLRPFQNNPWRLGGGAVLATLLISMIPSRRRPQMPLLVVAFFVLVCLASGCSSSGSPKSTTTPGTTAGNYTFTVTGTDSVNAAITVSTTVVVAVQ